MIDLHICNNIDEARRYAAVALDTSILSSVRTTARSGAGQERRLLDRRPMQFRGPLHSPRVYAMHILKSAFCRQSTFTYLQWALEGAASSALRLHRGKECFTERHSAAPACPCTSYFVWRDLPSHAPMRHSSSAISLGQC